jgi:hypothetical protein
LLPAVVTHRDDRRRGADLAAAGSFRLDRDRVLASIIIAAAA